MVGGTTYALARTRDAVVLWVWPVVVLQTLLGVTWAINSTIPDPRTQLL
jgi:hypothetical protein